MLGSSWVAAQLAASQEGLSSMSEWVREYCDMTPENRNSSLLDIGSVNIANAVISMVCVARVATQWWGKHTYAAMNQHATKEEAVFLWGPPRGYIMRTSRNKYSNSVAFRSFQLHQRIESISGVASWQNNCEEMARKELGCAKETS
jgi:hypothetical protein